MLIFRNLSRLLVPNQKRFQIIALCSLSIAISYADRSNISIAIIPMAAEYKWSEETKGLVLSSFFYGYLLTQVLGGYLAFRFGGKSILAIGSLLWSIFTILTPIAADYSFPLLFIFRIFLGLGEGLAFPAIHAILAKWCPPSEQARAVATVTAASYFGAILALVISSPVAESLGWRYIFYIFGGFGLLWNVPWHFYGASSPRRCPSISNLELGLIESAQRAQILSSFPGDTLPVSAPGENESLAGVLITSTEPQIQIQSREEEETVLLSRSNEHSPSLPLKKEKDSNENVNKLLLGEDKSEIPWLTILVCKEVWAILINQFCNSWGFYVLLGWLPSYYKDVFGIDLGQIGYFTILPYLVQGIVGLSSGYIGDYLQNDLKLFTVYQLRIYSQCIGMMGTAIFLMLGAYVAKSAVAGMLFITVALGLNALTLLGVSVSPHDIAPRYAGIIFGMGNTAATLPGIIGVYISGLLLDNGGDHKGDKGAQWDSVFLLAAIFYVIGTFVWYFMAGGKRIVIS